ncbi:hypothetical protein E3N88_19484 [Mikania micrantha]|uniref:BTB domain-containing protein n=1 Tax=Mikania micrantha TaxID=192012 RepID=A0A5N6NR34_9ASTR|nr:hypothetical protein E3N88_19484 [Mikania micrantha]
MCRQRSDVGCKLKLKLIMKWYIGLKCMLLIKKHTIRKWNFDVFEPKSMIMDSECSPHQAVTVCDHIDFRFDSNFSDRVLLIYMSSDQPFESPSAERVETLYINSQVLAARSPFFYKLFSNGMRESQQSNVTLRINTSEELAFMELLNFMYNNNLRVTNASDVLDVLITANKYDVASCMEHCSRSLKNLSMTPESLLVYLDLPSTVLMSEAFLPLTVAARQFYVVHYKDMTKIKYEDIISLPFAGVEAILASDDLQVLSEDFVYVFVLKWAKTHFPNLSDRRAIIATRLAKYIRYPFMSRRMLKQVLTSNNFDNKFAQKVVTEAISFKAEVPHTTYIKDKNSVLNRWFVERAYEYRPIKVVEFEQPRPHCVVYLDLKHDVCANLFPSGSVT